MDGPTEVLGLDRKTILDRIKAEIVEQDKLRDGDRWNMRKSGDEEGGCMVQRVLNTTITSTSDYAKIAPVLSQEEWANITSGSDGARSAMHSLAARETEFNTFLAGRSKGDARKADQNMYDQRVKIVTEAKEYVNSRLEAFSSYVGGMSAEGPSTAPTTPPAQETTH